MKNVEEEVKDLFDLTKTSSDENFGWEAILAKAIQNVFSEYARKYVRIQKFRIVTDEGRDGTFVRGNFFSCDKYLKNLSKICDVFKAVLNGEEYVPPKDVANIYNKLLKLENIFFKSIQTIESKMKAAKEVTKMERKKQELEIITLKLMENVIKNSFNAILGEKVFTDVVESKKIIGEIQVLSSLLSAPSKKSSKLSPLVIENIASYI